jgi:hypothetical protein
MRSHLISGHVSMPPRSVGLARLIGSAESEISEQIIRAAPSAEQVFAEEARQI